MTTEASVDTSGRNAAGATRGLLMCGVLAGAIYLAVGIAQGLLRDGFDFGRHPLSVLANGPGGWVQTANFVVTGLLVVAAAVGFQRVLPATSRATGIFLGAFGASMLVAAACPADAVDGFPVGTPLGPPTSISTLGLVHFAAGALGFVALAVSCLVASRAMSRRGERRLALLSLVSGVVILLGFFSVAVPNSSPVVGIWIAVVVGWLWLALMSRRLSVA
jgi:hypothetical membrane protein